MRALRCLLVIVSVLSMLASPASAREAIAAGIGHAEGQASATGKHVVAQTDADHDDHCPLHHPAQSCCDQPCCGPACVAPFQVVPALTRVGSLGKQTRLAPDAPRRSAGPHQVNRPPIAA